MGDTKRKVLFIDNNSGKTEYLKSKLGKQIKVPFELTAFNTFQNLKSMKDNIDTDIVIVGFTGYEVYSDVLEDCIKEYAELYPVIILTDYKNEIKAREYLKCGVQDIVVKEGLHSDKLFRFIDYSIERFKINKRHIRGKQKYKKKLEFLKTHDVLTGLHNRRYFERRMRRDDKNPSRPTGLIVFDLDGLKKINEAFGHEAGDIVLKDAAKIITGLFRKKDILSRIGGDEFAVILDNCDNNQIQNIIKRLKTEIDNYNRSSKAIYMSISHGFCLSSSNTENMKDIFKHAENNIHLEKILKKESRNSRAMNFLNTALFERDFIMEGHTARIEELILNISDNIQLKDRVVLNLILLSRFHDIGKIGTPDMILFKAGSLDDDEFSIMQKHTEIGFRIAVTSEELKHIAPLILKHHERWDGDGYPLGLRKDEIPFECRVLSFNRRI
jgi:diguanylate cyclase (GGDEF)-like protein